MFDIDKHLQPSLIFLKRLENTREEHIVQIVNISLDCKRQFKHSSLMFFDAQKFL